MLGCDWCSARLFPLNWSVITWVSLTADQFQLFSRVAATRAFFAWTSDAIQFGKSSRRQRAVLEIVPCNHPSTDDAIGEKIAEKKVRWNSKSWIFRDNFRACLVAFARVVRAIDKIRLWNFVWKEVSAHLLMPPFYIDTIIITITCSLFRIVLTLCARPIWITRPITPRIVLHSMQLPFLAKSFSGRFKPQGLPFDSVPDKIRT